MATNNSINKTSDSFNATVSITTPLIVQSRVDGTFLTYSSNYIGDTNNRFQMNAGGLMQWGPGNTTFDTTLQRTAAATLRIADSGGSTNGILDVNTTLTSTVTNAAALSITTTASNANITVSPNGTGVTRITTGLTAFRPIVAQSTSFTLAFSDAGAFEDCNSSSTITVTIPTNASVAFVIGTEIDLFRHGTGAVTFSAASGVTLLSQASDLNIGLQYQAATLKKIATDTWVLIGALTT